MTSYIYNMVDTWASGGGPYTSIKMNATDNDVGSASLLMDLQVGTVSKFSVSKAGSATFGGSITATASGSYVNAAGLSLGTGGAGGIFVSGGNAFTVNSSGGFRWSSNANVNVDTNGDLILTRRAAANLRFGGPDAAAPVAQTLSVQSVVAGTSNTAGTNLTITGSQGTGNAAGGSIIFQVAPAGSSGSAQNALATALTIGSDKSTRLEGALDFSGTGTVNIQANVNFLFIRSGTYRWGIGQDFIATSSTAFVGFSSVGTDIGGTTATNVDTRLYRDAANTLALRNGANAQTFNLYSTYTDASNYERMSLGYSASNDFTLTTSKAGTGSNRSLTFETYGAATFTIAAQTIATSSDGFFSWSSTTTSRGSTDTRLYRDAAGVIGVRGTSSTGGAALSFVEQTAPAAPATNGVRIYAEDNGSGKTRLMALFATGAAVQIAIEP